MHAWLDLHLLLLLAAANGMPIVGKRLFGGFADRALDGGAHWRGQPLFGQSKTIRGIALSLAVTPVLAMALGVSPLVGLIVALGAMAGDLISSFVKRRFGMPHSSRAPGLDQIPESLLPCLLVAPILPVTLLDIVAIVLTFVIADVAISDVLFHLGIRDQPY